MYFRIASIGAPPVVSKQWRKSVSYFDQHNMLPEAKNDPELTWLKEVPSQSLQLALRNLDTAFKNFFRGTGKYPRAKKKGIHDSVSESS
jgi:putative transposase